MANRYANLVGSNKIKDEYSKINTGFDAVQAEMDAVNAELDAHKADTVAHVTQAEHDKLAGIEPGAQVNQNAFSRINDVSATTEEDAVTFQGGTGIIITTDPATKRVIWTATGEATPGPHASSHITGGTDVIPDAVANVSSGLMSAADKAKLDSIPNDVGTQLSNIRSDLGDMSTVPTTAKNAAGAISELFTSVSDGKTLIAGAITDKGVPTSPSDTFATMAANIGAIETGGPWMNDWSAYQTVYDWSGTTRSVPAGSWHTFVDVTGEGWLVFVRSNVSSTSESRVRITIDGISYIFQGPSPLGYYGSLLAQPIYFSTSLKIEVYNGAASSLNLSCDYTYLLKTGSPNINNQSILQAGQRNGILHNTNSTSLVDAVNITGSGYLLGVEFSAYSPTGEAGAVYAQIIIDSQTKMNDRFLLTLYGTGTKLHFFNGPVRFTSSLIIRHRSNHANSNAVTRIYYTLD